MFQHGELVCLGAADGGVQASFAFAGREDIPQPDAVREQARQALVVGQSGQFVAEDD